ncbi:hypothetical protein [Anaerovorax odorimutans]|uniref:hypothetical protein n=1 Tax=Anaerovorax odorimutans TaxID=109327 RepID=UPI0003FA00D6|nr:hypothetical protein [Anaerovorax odorimutans]
MKEFVEDLKSGIKYKVNYKYEKNVVWASIFVNGQEIRKHGDSEETALWALEQAIYQTLYFRL